MKITKQPTNLPSKILTGECARCRAEIECEEGEVENIVDQGRYLKMVKCPCCENHIFVWATKR